MKFGTLNNHGGIVAETIVGDISIGASQPRLCPPPPQRSSATAEAGNLAFLSYSRADKAVVHTLVDLLGSEGVEIWIDEQQLEPGDSLPRHLAAAIGNARHFVVFLSPDAVVSPWVARELALALALEVNQRRPNVIPVVLAPCRVPIELADRVYEDLSGWAGDRESRSLKRLLSALRG